MIPMSIFWALVLALFATNLKHSDETIATHTNDQKKSRKWFRARPRWHDPMLVLNISIFNSGSSETGSSIQFCSARTSGVKQ